MKLASIATGALLMALLLHAAPSHAQVNININTRPYYTPQYVVVKEAKHPKKWKAPKHERVLLVPAGPVYVEERGHGHGRGHGKGRD